MPKQVPKIGDLFQIPLDDGSSAFGQVLEITPVLMNSMTCAFFDQRANNGSEDLAASTLAAANVMACLFVTRDAFNRGKWLRIMNAPPVLEESDLPYRDTAAKGWVGAKVIGSGIVTSFLSAYFGLRDWKEMKDPRYYETLLFRGRSGPASA